MNNDISENYSKKELYKALAFGTLCSLIVFFLTLLIERYYVCGDQAHYIYAYDNVHQFSIRDGFFFYRNALGSSELLHFLIIWSAAPFVEKSVVMGVSNAALTFVSILVLRRCGATFLISFLIVFLSYYSFVLFFSAERLKFALIFFLASILLSHKLKLFAPAFILSVISHVQIFALYASSFMSYVLSDLKILFFSGRVRKQMLVILPLGFIGLIFMSGQVLSKYEYYLSGFQLLDVIKILFLTVLTLIYSKGDYLRVFSMFFPLIILTFIFGSDRILMFAALVFIYFSCSFNGGKNLGMLIFLSYGLYKTIVYLYAVFFYGNGFYFAALRTCI